MKCIPPSSKALFCGASPIGPEASAETLMDWETCDKTAFKKNR